MLWAHADGVPGRVVDTDISTPVADSGRDTGEIICDGHYELMASFLQVLFDVVFLFLIPKHDKEVNQVENSWEIGSFSRIVGPVSVEAT